MDDVLVRGPGVVVLGLVWLCRSECCGMVVVCPESANYLVAEWESAII